MIERLKHGLLPALLAALLVAFYPLVSDVPWIADNTSLFAVLCAIGFLIPITREFLFLTIIFGSAFYSGRHGVESLMWAREQEWFIRSKDWVTIVQWHLIAVFAFVAGVGESASKVTSWGRRFYFLAIAAYFLGMATVSSVEKQWLKMMGLGILGAIALYGAIALPLVGPVKQEPEEPVEPEAPLVEIKDQVTVRRF